MTAAPAMIDPAAWHDAALRVEPELHALEFLLDDWRAAPTDAATSNAVRERTHKLTEYGGLVDAEFAEFADVLHGLTHAEAEDDDLEAVRWRLMYSALDVLAARLPGAEPWDDAAAAFADGVRGEWRQSFPGRDENFAPPADEEAAPADEAPAPAHDYFESPQPEPNVEALLGPDPESTVETPTESDRPHVEFSEPEPWVEPWRVIDEALEIASSWQDTPAVAPEQIHEAFGEPDPDAPTRIDEGDAAVAAFTDAAEAVFPDEEPPAATTADAYDAVPTPDEPPDEPPVEAPVEAMAEADLPYETEATVEAPTSDEPSFEPTAEAEILPEAEPPFEVAAEADLPFATEPSVEAPTPEEAVAQIEFDLEPESTPFAEPTPEPEPVRVGLYDSIIDRKPTESQLDLWDVSTADRDLWLEENAAILDELRTTVLNAKQHPTDGDALLDAAAALDAYRASAARAGRIFAADLAERLADIPWRAAETQRSLNERQMSLLRRGVRALTDLATGCYHPDDFQTLLRQLDDAFVEASAAPDVSTPLFADAPEDVEAPAPTETSSAEDRPPEPVAALEEAPPPTEPSSWGNDLSANMLELYTGEAERLIRALLEAAADLNVDPQDEAALHAGYRAAHTMVGASSAVGYSESSRVAGMLEAVFEQLQSGERRWTMSSADLVDVGVRLLDRLRLDGGVESGALDGFQDRCVRWLQSAELEQTLIDDAAPARRLTARPVTPPPAPAPAEASVVDEPPDLGIDQIPAELLEVFTEEADDHLKHIHAGLTRLRARRHDREALQEVRRSAHTLKGAAGAVGLKTATKLAHRMEDLLDKLYEGERPLDAESAEVLQETADLLGDLAAGLQPPPAARKQISDLYARYAKLLEDEATPSAAALEPKRVVEPIKDSLDEPPPDATPASDGSSLGDSSGGFASEPLTRSAPGARARPQGSLLRVPLERMDELVRLVSELVINRTALEQRMTGFVRLVEDLRSAAGKLRGAASELQNDYETTALREPGGPTPALLTQSALGDFDALEFDRYTKFHLLTRALAESASDAFAVAGEFGNLHAEFDALLGRQSRLSRSLQDRLMRTRMVPLSSIATRLERTVRATAQATGKRVELEVRGEGTELDKTVLEEMLEPFQHLLRNCIDHGLEDAAGRAASGKPVAGRVFVHAHYQGTQIIVQVGDDGRGLDEDRIRAKAVAQGLLSPEAASTARAEDLYQFLFAPGFSTASAISEISGRGVGLDVVRSKVLKLKGAVTVDSTPGRGAVFTIRLPMTLAIVRSLLVSIHGQTFAVPMQAVSQILRVDRSAIASVAGGDVMFHGGRVYSLYRLGETLRLPKLRESNPGLEPVLVVYTGTREVAVQVDKIISGREIVVKTLGTHLRRVHGLIGATFLGDGAIVPILNLAELFGAVRGERTESPHLAPPTTTAAKPLERQILVVDDSVSVRRVTSNILKTQNWIPLQAKDGMDAFDQLRAMRRVPDAILLDVEMPRMNGYELLAALKDHDAFRRIPVVMITSRAGDKHRTKALELGAAEYLVKPFQPDELLALIRRLTAV